MSAEYGARESKRSKMKHISFDESSDKSLIETSNEPKTPTEDSDSLNRKSDLPGGLADMTEEEMAQHLKLCMKLSAENKINMKNAFGLHLIEIMQKVVNESGKTDIQQASLSLYASSKIYAGRVEALYQDTCRFHGHLQSIVSGGKKEKKFTKNVDDEDDMEDDVLEKVKNKHSKNKCNSFLKPEETLSIVMDVIMIVTGEPHGNFVTIKSAFSTSRLAPKLLRSLRLVGDSCILKCSISELNFKPKQTVNSIPFVVSPKLKVSLEKIKNFHVSQALLSSMEVNSSPQMTTPKPAAHPLLFSDEEHFDTGCHEDSMMAPPDPLDGTIEKFDVLNITVDALVNDISAAVTNGGIDHSLLPPNSTLKKMLDKSRRSSIKPSVGKSTRTKKVKEPFFNHRTANDIRHLFAKGRSTTISQRILSEWNIENTSKTDLTYEFIEDIESKSEQETTNLIINSVQSNLLDVVKQNDLQYYFKYYFNKESQLWKIYRRKLILEQSYSCTPCGNQTEIRRFGSVVPNDPEGLALSFQNMSLHDSVHEAPPDFEGEVSVHNIPALDGDDDEEQQFLVPSEPFETDIEEMMVKPPELVRPTSMKFDQRPVNLNTEKIKHLLWTIISRSLESERNSNGNSESFVLFSKVYEELKLKLEKELSESISMQFAFVVLLIVANQKTLLIENMEENMDLRIKQDMSEIDISQNK